MVVRDERVLEAVDVAFEQAHQVMDRAEMQDLVDGCTQMKTQKNTCVPVAGLQTLAKVHGLALVERHHELLEPLGAARPAENLVHARIFFFKQTRRGTKKKKSKTWMSKPKRRKMSNKQETHAKIENKKERKKEKRRKKEEKKTHSL